jgi:inhibitor of Bruton tyrosine kinase
VREMAFKATQKEEERKLSSSLKGKYGSLDDFVSLSTSPDRARRVSRVGKNAPFSPELRPKESQADLMFAMDDDAATASSPSIRAQRPRDQTSTTEIDQLPSLSESWEGGRRTSSAIALTPLASPPAMSLSRPGPTPVKGQSEKVSPNPSKDGNPWGQPAAPASKTDLRNLLSESTNMSLLSAGLAAQKAKEVALRPAQQKMSQKEKKKQQQAQAAAEAAELASRAQQSKTAWEKSPSETQTPPWKLVASREKTSLKDLLSDENKVIAKPANKSLLAASASPAYPPRRAASPDTRFPGQQRTSGGAAHIPDRPPSKPTGTASSSSLPRGTPSAGTSSSNVPNALNTSTPAKPLVPHSKLYLTPGPKAEATIGFSMADIIGQQEREQQHVKDAVAKRSLQEIQAEQEFEEWWETESRRTQEEEAKRLAREKGRDKDEKDGGPKKSGGRRGRGGKPKTAAPASPIVADASGSKPKAATAKSRGYRGGRGKAGAAAAATAAAAAGGESSTQARAG